MRRKMLDFYHVVKNEDAYPFSCQNENGGFIVAADGLGGSGSSVHTIKPEHARRLEELLKACALPEYFCVEDVKATDKAKREEPPINRDGNGGEGHPSAHSYGAYDGASDGTPDMTLENEDDQRLRAPHASEGASETRHCKEQKDSGVEAVGCTFSDDLRESFEAWIAVQMRDMLDETPDTSALWGSRIAIMRFVHYMLTHPEAELSNEAVLQDIVAYVYKGLTATQKQFELVTGGQSSQAILPTTLVCMRYKKISHGNVLVETVWAGDSRAYALIPGEGMKQISQDDEDASGALNNLFALRADGSMIQTCLHYVAHTLPEKSAIFVCSDGVFDPYAPIDNIGVELALMEAIQASENWADVEANWKGHYSPMRHDDTSVAMVVFDDDFADFRRTYTRSLEKIRGAFEAYEKGKRFYEYVDRTEDDPSLYVIDRARVRKPQIAQLIAANLISPEAERDAVITDSLVAYLEDYKVRWIEEKKEPICNGIITSLSQRLDILDDVFLPPAEEQDPAIRDRISALRSSLSDLLSLRESVKQRDGLIEQGNLLCDQIQERMTNLDELIAWCDSVLELIYGKESFLADFYGKDTEGAVSMAKTLQMHIAFYQNRSRHACATRQKIKELLDQWQAWQQYGIAGLRLDPEELADREILPYVVRRKTSGVELTLQNTKELIENCLEQEEIDPVSDILKLQNSPLAIAGGSGDDDPSKAQNTVRLLEPMLQLYTSLRDMILQCVLLEKEIGSPSQAQETFTQLATAYAEQLCSFKDCLSVILDQPEVYLTEDAILAYDIGLSHDMDQQALAEAICAAFESDASLYDDFLQAFLKCESSVIDGVFNRSRLLLYRDFASVDLETIALERDDIERCLLNYEDTSAYRKA